MLQFQLDSGLHDLFYNLFRVRLATIQTIDGFNHLTMYHMFLAKVLLTNVIDGVLLGIRSNRLMPGSLPFKRFFKYVPGSRYRYPGQ